VSAFSLAELVLTLAFVAWGLRRVALRRAGFVTSFALATLRLAEEPDPDPAPDGELDEDLGVIADVG
jgi:hypothetical protein